MTFATPELRRAIGFWGGTAIIVGTVIGSGIFRTPQKIAEVLPNPYLTLTLWMVVGVLSLCGALTLAELSSMMPRTGGTYVYLRSAYGGSAAFTFGWVYLLAARPSGAGALSVALGEGVVRLMYPDPSMAPRFLPQGIGIGMIAFLCVSNIIGVRWGAAIQKTFTVVKVGALLGLIALAIFMGWGMSEASPKWAVVEDTISPLEGFCAAIAFVLFAYNGWIYIGLVAGEVEDPGKRLKKIVVVGMVTIIAVYLGANLVYLGLLQPETIAKEKFVAVKVVELLAGRTGGIVMNVCIIGSMFGALNGVILTKTRVPYAMARDGLTFDFLGACHPKWSTPYASILVQGGVAIALICILQEFGNITAYFVVVEWAALIFAIASVFVLRRKMPDEPRPFRTPLYPWVPLFFVVGTTIGLAVIIWSRIALLQDYAPLIGLGVSLLGFPVYWMWKSLKSQKG